MEQTIIDATTMEIQLKEVFEQHCTRQVLFVLGASFRKQKLYGRLQELMKNAGVGCTEFSDFQPNPKYESVVAGIEALRAHHCDFIIAAGGGSAMDVAKCIKLFSEMDLSKNCLEQEIVENALPLLAIPTTAGTGSEATRFAVIYYQGCQYFTHIETFQSALDRLNFFQSVNFESARGQRVRSLLWCPF